MYRTLMAKARLLCCTMPNTAMPSGEEPFRSQCAVERSQSFQSFSAGDFAMNSGHQEAFDLLLNVGIQAELILGTISRRAYENGDSNRDYLEDRIDFSEDKLMDSNSKAIMMAWEKPLMEAPAKASSGGSHMLNI